MALGGHDTFAVREGWLYKGLNLLRSEEPERLWDEHAGDWLGVGRNMAKAIRHWLVATGLAEATRRGGPAKGVPLVTRLGQLVFQHDPDTLEPGTWWALHVNVINNVQSETWGWFFNHFHATRFDRATCIEQLRRHLQATRSRLPSARTIERDVACLLLSYSRQVPPANDDPEDARESPFVHLGVMLHHRTSGHFEVLRGKKDIPVELLGYCLARGPLPAGEGRPTGQHRHITLHDAVYIANGPGRAFGLDPEGLHELSSRAEEALGPKRLRLQGLAGERSLRLQAMPPEAWLQLHYKACKGRKRHVA